MFFDWGLILPSCSLFSEALVLCFGEFFLLSSLAPYDMEGREFAALGTEQPFLPTASI